MKKQPKLTKRQTQIATLLIVLAVIFVYNFIKSETKEEPKVVEKKAIVVTAFFTIQKETNYYTPDNYLLKYYKNINSKNWDYLLQNTLNNYNLDFIKGQFTGKNIKGVKVVSVDKESKVKAIVTTDITYTNSLKDTIAERVKAQLQLSTDYQTWIVAPLTVF